MKRLIPLCLFILAVSFAATAAHAEGCDSTPRPLTAQEKTFYSKFTMLRAAIPQPPADGWQFKDDTKKKLGKGYSYQPTEYCPNSGYSVSFKASYERPMTQADSDKEMAVMHAPPDPAKQKQLQDLTNPRMALMQQSIAAAQKQDMKTVDALGKQGDALDKQMRALQANMNSSSQATIAAIQADREASVDINLNSGAGADCYGSPKPIQVPGATAYACEHPATYSSPGEQLDAPLGRIIVVFGPAKLQTDDNWNRKDPEGKGTADKGVILDTPADVHNSTNVGLVIVSISADNLARAQLLFKKMDLKPLAALLNH